MNHPVQAETEIYDADYFIDPPVERLAAFEAESEANAINFPTVDEVQVDDGVVNKPPLDFNPKINDRVRFRLVVLLLFNILLNAELSFRECTHKSCDSF